MDLLDFSSLSALFIHAKYCHIVFILVERQHYRSFSQQTQFTSNIKDGSVLLKCPSKTWDAQYQDTEADKWNPALITFIIYTCAVPPVTCLNVKIMSRCDLLSQLCHPLSWHQFGTPNSVVLLTQRNTQYKCKKMNVSVLILSNLGIFWHFPTNKCFMIIKLNF